MDAGPTGSTRRQRARGVCATDRRAVRRGTPCSRCRVEQDRSVIAANVAATAAGDTMGHGSAGRIWHRERRGDEVLRECARRWASAALAGRAADRDRAVRRRGRVHRRSESLDIEDRGRISGAFPRIATEQVERFGGVIAKFIGDGVMALFGAPVAHEDDSERAVRAALAIQQQLETLREERPRLALHVRIGITTGQVLLRFGDDGRVDGVGDAVNTAARLEAAAPVDGVLVGARTRRATAGRIEYDEVAPVQAKGKSRPWRRPSPVAPGGTPAILRPARSWVAARSANSCGPDFTASAMHDKPPRSWWLDRLAPARAGWCTSFACVSSRGDIRPGGGRGAQLPSPAAPRCGRSAEILKLHSGVLDDDTAAVATAKLDTAIAALIGDRDEADWVVRALRPLLGLGDAGDAPVDGAEAAAAWRAFAHALARSRPTVLLFEDLHWADDATLDLVRGLTTTPSCRCWCCDRPAGAARPLA